MPSVLMINPTNVVGGVERPIENYLSCLDQSRFSAAYAVTPFDGDEEHLSRIRATGAKVVDLSPVCSVKKAGLEISGGSFRQADTNGLKPFLVGLWKAAMPACWDEWQYHVRQHRCLRPRFRRALAQASVMPDVVHLLGGQYWWMAACFQECRMLFPRAAIAVHLWNPPAFRNPTFLERRIFREADGQWFVSRDTQRRWEFSMGLKFERSRILPNPVRMDRSDRQSGIQRRDGRLRLVTLGRLSPIKGVDTALRALALLAREGMDVELNILGSGPEDDRLRELAKDLDVDSRVLFRGFVSDPSVLLHEMDILLQPSQTEGVPGSVIEAMAIGLPVVVSPVGGLPEIVEDGVTGLVAPVGEASAWANAIRGLAQDLGKSAAIALAGRQFARERFQARRATAALEDVYDELMARRS